MMTTPGTSDSARTLTLPTGWTFAALAAGLALGWALAGGRAIAPLLALAGPVGTLWLRALQMTIIPLVAALLVTGIARMVATARAGAMARRTLAWFVAVLAAGTLLAAVATPALLAAFPIPGAAPAALAADSGAAQAVPGIGAFFETLVAPNVVAAAAETAMLPLVVFFTVLALAIALSTQSSLASLPAMLAVCRTLEVRETTADFVLPLAVAVFRATSPAMNLAVAIYVARLTGVPLTPATIAAGAGVALVTTVGSVSLPGAVSFVTSVGPIALAVGVPVGPLALLVAVEMLPDLMRTVGNVTMDSAVAATVDRSASDSD